ncbi:acyl-CoA thioester hydrolase [Anoxybacillus tepidamans]|uniref:Acyl-CoA thioester hydrolase n=1 Tax=Anoxybacteroides tepidamans TaxID=265948 RepID=A0A7W8MWZ1_9BACL|nr:thioesterase family protein [Anoxybacillus tepidamans]MBB5325871.1 acyl-CoA thioester hydrolase [Anoxybacillus tepidamans]
MSAHVTTITVRFCETDALGHVNNTNYFVYLEEARIRLFEQLGYGTDVHEWRFILASAKCDFVNQAYFGQTLNVETNVSKIGNKSFHIVHRILDAKTKALIAIGETAVVYFNFETQKSEPIPDDLRQQLQRYMLSDAEQAKES